MSMAQLLKSDGWDCYKCRKEIEGTELVLLQAAVDQGEQICPWYLCDSCLQAEADRNRMSFWAKLRLFFRVPRTL